jgi:hypothetical protein
MGDFNAHYSEQLPCRSTPIGKKFHSFLEINNLVQLISEPTRVNQCSLTIFDLLITNCSSDFSSRGILSPPSNCDHSIIYGEMNFHLYKSPCLKRDVWNFSNVDILNLNRELDQVDCSLFLVNESDIDVAYEKWYRQFRCIVEKFIPFKTVTIRPNDKPWMNGRIRLSIRKRNRFQH